MKEQLISVIIPVYNEEKYLPQCLDSLIGQTYQNLEIILVDDASADTSLDICLRYQERDARIRVIKKEKNAGISAARNAGIEVCRGQYIYFLDSDDFILPETLTRMYEAIVKNDADIAICAMERVDVSGRGIEVLTLPEIACTDVKKVYELLSQGSMTCMVQTKLYRRRLFEKLRFPVGKQYEDVFIFGDALKQCQRVTILSEAYFKYRIHAEAFSKRPYELKHMDVIEAFVKLYQDMKADQTEYLWYAKHAAYTRLIDAIKKCQFREPEKKRIQMLRRQVLRCCGLHLKYTPMVFAYYWMRQAGYVFKEYRGGEAR